MRNPDDLAYNRWPDLQEIMCYACILCGFDGVGFLVTEPVLLLVLQLRLLVVTISMDFAERALRGWLGRED